MMEATTDACQVCNGSGYLRYAVGPEHPLFGVIAACYCTRATIEARRQAVLASRSMLPKRLLRETFEVWDKSTKRNEIARRTVQSFAEDSGAEALYLFGEGGAGKTKLAASAVNYRISHGLQASFFVVPDLLDHLRATFGPSSEVSYDELFEQVRTAEFLVLDELRTDGATNWALEKLYQVLNSRYNDELPTIMTSNVEPEDLDPIVRRRVASESVQVIRMERHQ